jgi:hypothetical protein
MQRILRVKAYNSNYSFRTSPEPLLRRRPERAAFVREHEEIPSPLGENRLLGAPESRDLPGCPADDLRPVDGA